MKKTPAAVTLRLPDEAIKGVLTGLAQAGVKTEADGEGIRIGALLVRPASEVPVTENELTLFETNGVAVDVRLP